MVWSRAGAERRDRTMISASNKRTSRCQPVKTHTKHVTAKSWPLTFRKSSSSVKPTIMMVLKQCCKEAWAKLTPCWATLTAAHGDQILKAKVHIHLTEMTFTPGSFCIINKWKCVMFLFYLFLRFSLPCYYSLTSIWSQCRSKLFRLHKLPL